MKADTLKKSILQWAIEGKLVPQLESEPGVEQIGEVPEDVPFAIPEKWKWVRLIDVLIKLTDGEHKTPAYKATGIPFISVKNISSGTIDFSNTKFISEEDYQIFKKRCNPESGDILLSKVGTTGVPAIVKGDTKFSLFVSVALLKLSRKITSDLLWYWIQSPVVQEQAKLNTRGIGNKNWVLKSIGSTLIPLPPLEEQHRIVAKLNELLPLVESYGKEQEALENVEKEFPDKLRASLLQEAIQGKLVPQLESEPEVEQIGEAPEDVPFAIPEKWKWVLFSDAVKVISSRPFQIKAKEVLGQGLYPVISQSKEQIDGYSNDDKKLIPDSELPIIIFGDHTRTLKYVDFRFVVGADGTKLLHVKTSSIDPKYFYIALQSMIGQTRQRGYSRHFQFLKVLHIPIPPIEEQRRIVAKLNELLNSTSQLERTISTP